MALIFLPIVFLIQAGCATMSADKTRLASIHRVALVGFTVKQQVPEGLEWKVGGNAARSNAPAIKGGIGKESAHATTMYSALQKELKDAMRWTVVDRSRLESNPAYRNLYQQTMKGWQNRPPVGVNMEVYSAPGVVDSFPIQRLDAAERRRLIQDLGVDAIAFAEVTIVLEKAGGLKKLVGAGEFKPRARTYFVVYDRSSDEPTWKDVAANGKTVAEGVSHVFGIASPDALNEKAVSAAQSSYHKLIDRYKEQSG